MCVYCVTGPTSQVQRNGEQELGQNKHQVLFVDITQNTDFPWGVALR